MSTLLNYDIMDTKKPGRKGKLLFRKYKDIEVVVTEWLKEDQIPQNQLEDFDWQDCLWLRRLDGLPFDESTDDSIMRDNDRECVFHNYYFNPSKSEWDEECNG